MSKAPVPTAAVQAPIIALYREAAPSYSPEEASNYNGHYRDCVICHSGLAGFNHMLRHMQWSHGNRTSDGALLAPLQLPSRKPGRPTQHSVRLRTQIVNSYWDNVVKPLQGLMYNTSADNVCTETRQRQWSEERGAPLPTLIRQTTADSLSTKLEMNQYVAFANVWPMSVHETLCGFSEFEAENDAVVAMD